MHGVPGAYAPGSAETGPTGLEGFLGVQRPGAYAPGSAEIGPSGLRGPLGSCVGLRDPVPMVYLPCCCDSGLKGRFPIAQGAALGLGHPRPHNLANGLSQRSLGQRPREKRTAPHPQLANGAASQTLHAHGQQHGLKPVLRPPSTSSVTAPHGNTAHGILRGAKKRTSAVLAADVLHLSCVARLLLRRNVLCLRRKVLKHIDQFRRCNGRSQTFRHAALILHSSFFDIHFGNFSDRLTVEQFNFLVVF